MFRKRNGTVGQTVVYPPCRPAGAGFNRRGETPLPAGRPMVLHRAGHSSGQGGTTKDPNRPGQRQIKGLELDVERVVHQTLARLNHKVMAQSQTATSARKVQCSTNEMIQWL